MEVREFTGNDGEIWAKIQDDSQVRWAWAIIYPPSYKPPASSNEIVPEPLPVPLLRRDHGDDGWYGIDYDEFDEMGSYRIVVYAEDQPGLQSRPQELLLQTGYQLYLPAVRR